MDESRECGRCGQLRPTESFLGATGRSFLSCQQCREYARRINQASRDARPGSNRAMNLWTKYRITEAFYDELRSRQGYRCAICGIHEDEIPATLAGRPRKDGKPSAQAFRLVVDHCHGTSAIRGLLCNGCNSALGHFRDSVEALRRAMDYLESEPLTVPPRAVV
ncbi:endonuclease VII domain-containing protein [Micromonospora lupini]|uniref:endonuclease VII domain-containing protein n=1 Tax=Micromonospora lupini TaxID=285679 RepID=UPI0031E1F05D